VSVVEISVVPSTLIPAVNWEMLSLELLHSTSSSEVAVEQVVESISPDCVQVTFAS